MIHFTLEYVLSNFKFESYFDLKIAKSISGLSSFLLWWRNRKKEKERVSVKEKQREWTHMWVCILLRVQGCDWNRVLLSFWGTRSKRERNFTSEWFCNWVFVSHRHCGVGTDILNFSLIRQIIHSTKFSAYLSGEKLFRC